jgi:hypothetical protein
MICNVSVVPFGAVLVVARMRVMIVEESIGGVKVEDLGVIDGDVVGGDDVADAVVVGDDVFDLFGYDYSVFSVV